MATMPTESIYFPEKDREYVRELRERNDLENPSRAVQELVAFHREHSDE